MDSYENVALLLKKSYRLFKKSYHNKSKSFTLMVSQHLLQPSAVDIKTKFQFELLCKTLFDFINDPTQSPETMIHLLDTYLPKLYESDPIYSRAFRNVVANFCLRGLANRMPVFEGSWEKLLLIIIRLSKGTEHDGDSIISNASQTDIIWLNSIQKLCSKEKCPNPFLRLELIRLNNWYFHYFGKNDYDNKSVRESVISTLFDIDDKNPSFQSFEMEILYSNDRIYMTAKELHKTLTGYYLDIQSIAQKDHPKAKQIRIIEALINVTVMYTQFEKLGDYVYRHKAAPNFYACSTFFGLIAPSQENWKEENVAKVYLNIMDFIKAIHDKPILVNNVIATFFEIDDADRYLWNSTDDNFHPENLHLRLRDMIILIFFKHYVEILPMYYHLRQMNGTYRGTTLVTKRQLKFFSYNVKQYIIEDYNRSIKNATSKFLFFDASVSGDDISEYASEESFSDDSESGDDNSESDSQESFSLVPKPRWQKALVWRGWFYSA